MIDLYLITTKNLESFLNALLSAQAPDRFTQKFLESLEFKSTNDRLFIKMLKDLGFLDISGAPTQRYYDYLDQSQSKIVLAVAIKEAYGELFKIKTDAHKLNEDEVKGKLKTLTGGKRSENVYSLMSKTFVALCNLADFTTSPSTIQEHQDKAQKISDKNHTEENLHDEVVEKQFQSSSMSKPLSLHYNIQIILPDTRDQKVFDSIFSSLKRHLG